MKTVYGLALIALLALAGGCVSIGADEAKSGGRLVPVGDDAADFARARILVLDDETVQLRDVEAVLEEQRELSLKLWQDWLNRSADAWSDRHYMEAEQPYVAAACSGLAQESMGQVDRNRALICVYDSRTSTMAMVRQTERRNMEAFSSMRLVAP